MRRPACAGLPPNPDGCASETWREQDERRAAKEGGPELRDVVNPRGIVLRFDDDFRPRAPAILRNRRTRRQPVFRSR